MQSIEAGDIQTGGVGATCRYQACYCRLLQIRLGQIMIILQLNWTRINLGSSYPTCHTSYMWRSRNYKAVFTQNESISKGDTLTSIPVSGFWDGLKYLQDEVSSSTVLCSRSMLFQNGKFVFKNHQNDEGIVHTYAPHPNRNWILMFSSEFMRLPNDNTRL